MSNKVSYAEQIEQGLIRVNDRHTNASAQHEHDDHV